MQGWPIPLWGFVETFAGLSVIIIARYFLIVWPVYWALWVRTPSPDRKCAARRLSRRDPNRATIINEIRLSVISSFIYVFPAAVVLEMWKAGGRPFMAVCRRARARGSGFQPVRLSICLPRTAGSISPTASCITLNCSSIHMPVTMAAYSRPLGRAFPSIQSKR